MRGRAAARMAGVVEGAVGCSRSLRTVMLVTMLVLPTLLMQAVAPGAMASAATSGKDGRDGGSVVFGTYTGITSLDPVHINGSGTAGGNEGGAVFGYLMRYNTTTKKYVPYLAKSLTSSDHLTDWTLGLRPGMTFSDGTPFDADAVVENIKRDMATPSAAQTTLSLVSSVAATNSTTVVFTLKQPWSGFPFLLSYVPGLIAAPSYLAQVDAGNAQATPVGAGPFEVESFQPGTSLTLKPNPHYSLVRPKLSSLKFTNVPGGPSTLQAFQAGQLNSAILIDAPSVSEAKSDGIPSIASNFDIGTEILLNNRTSSPLASQELREAITLAFNPKTWNERMNQGVPLASDLLFPKGSAWYTPNEEKIPYNPKKAAQLVKKVEQQTGWNGTLGILATSVNPEVPVVMEAMLKPIGITVDPDLTTITTGEIDVIVKHDFDMSFWSATIDDSQPFYGLWSNFVSPTNAAGYSNQGTTTAVNSFGSATTTQSQRSAMNDFISSFLSSYPVVSSGVATWSTIHKSNVRGLYQTVMGTTLFDKATVSS